MFIVYEHLKPQPKIDGSYPQLKNSWENRLIKKYFDTPQYNGFSLPAPCGAPYLEYTLRGANGTCLKLICGEKRPAPFACCGMTELHSFGLMIIPSFDFLNEYWEFYNKHVLVPTFFILAQEGRRDLYPNYDMMRKHSHLVRKFRNIRYENHILELRCFFNNAGKEALFDTKTKDLALKAFPEWLET